LEEGVHLVHAGGYPIHIKDGYAVFYPGNLLSGQQRNLFLTFQVPTDKAQDLTIASFRVRYHHEGDECQIDSGEKISLTCIEDKKAVMSSIDKANWGEKVIQEDFTILKDAVADAIRKGQKEDAVRLINEYEKDKRGINSTVGSKIVTENLEGDVQDLHQSVEETFAGSPSAIEEKKKQRAKALQYESYRMRRDKR
jgi:Ca-activated chloride channel family protein